MDIDTIWSRVCTTPLRQRQRSREYYAKNRDKILAQHRARYDAKKQKAHSLKSAYGLSAERYEREYGKQQGCCGICGTWHETLCVDHCHASGVFRGLLCKSCNFLIGQAGDEEAVLINAILYLRAANERIDAVKERLA